VGKFAAFSERPKAKNVSASGGGALPPVSPEALPPGPHYRGLTLVWGGLPTL